MKTEKLVWGLILIFIGGIFLLENFDVIDFYWGSIWKFWPLILIVIGVNMLFSRSDIAAGPYLSVVLTILVLTFIGYRGITNPDNDSSWLNSNIKHRIDADWDDDDSKDKVENKLTEPWSAGIVRAGLNIRGGAISYTLDDTTSNLVDASVKGTGSAYTMTTEVKDDSVHVVDLNMKSHKNRFRFNEMGDNEARVRLNTRPLWDIDVNVGAGESNLDLTAFKVRSLDFKGGAASFKAKLGEPLTETSVSANTGVSEVVISVPKTVACEIKVSSGLSSKDFDGFSKRSDGSYTTPGFDNNPKKIRIVLKGGLSDFKVKRY